MQTQILTTTIRLPTTPHRLMSLTTITTTTKLASTKRITAAKVQSTVEMVTYYTTVERKTTKRPTTAEATTIMQTSKVSRAEILTITPHRLVSSTTNQTITADDSSSTKPDIHFNFIHCKYNQIRYIFIFVFVQNFHIRPTLNQIKVNNRGNITNKNTYNN